MKPRNLISAHFPFSSRQIPLRASRTETPLAAAEQANVTANESAERHCRFRIDACGRTGGETRGGQKKPDWHFRVLTRGDLAGIQRHGWISPSYKGTAPAVLIPNLQLPSSSNFRDAQSKLPTPKNGSRIQESGRRRLIVSTVVS